MALPSSGKGAFGEAGRKWGGPRVTPPSMESKKSERSHPPRFLTIGSTFLPCLRCILP